MKWLSGALAVVGVVLLAVALTYALVPAHALPGFLPGYKAGSDRMHHGHAVLVAGLGVVAVIGAWQARRAAALNP